MSSTGNARDDEPDPRSELSALIQHGLGHPVDRHVFEELAAMQAKLHSQRQELARLLCRAGIRRGL